MDSRDFRTMLRGTVVLPLVLLAMLAGVLLVNSSFLTRSFRSFEFSESLVGTSRQFLRSALEMESDVRGYTLSGDRSFLVSYDSAKGSAQRSLGDLDRISAPNAPIHEKAALLRAAFDEWQAWSGTQVVDTGTKRSPATASDELRGKQLMDNVRSANEALLDEVETERRGRAENIRKLSHQTLILTAVLSFAVAVVIAFTTHRRMSALVHTYNKHLREERRQSQESHDAREHLFTTLRSLSEAVFSTDAGGKITFLNSVAERLTGTTLEGAQGKELNSVLTLVDEHTFEPVSNLVDQVRSSAAPLEDAQTYSVRRPDGQFVYVERSAAPIRSSNNNLNGVVVLLRDVTERKKTEAALRSSDRLSLLGRLSATIAHEIRNPLESVMSLLYLLRNPVSGTDGTELVRIAEEELSRITQITQQLLSFNRESAEPRDTDVADLIDSAIALFGRKIATSNISIHKEVEPHPRILALPGELRQVFTNLLANSIDALSNGGTVRVHVRSAPSWRGAPGVVLTFSDSGTGIPAGAMQSLFTPFFTTKGDKGTGLGLWVSRGIVQKHRGTMRLRTSTGLHHGTTFSIYLPQQFSTTNSTAS